MANNVTASVLAGQPKIVNGVTTVNDIATQLSLPTNHSVQVNGADVSYDYELSDFDFVAFGKKVEGGL